MKSVSLEETCKSFNATLLEMREEKGALAKANTELVSVDEKATWLLTEAKSHAEGLVTEAQDRADTLMESAKEESQTLRAEAEEAVELAKNNIKIKAAFLRQQRDKLEGVLNLAYREVEEARLLTNGESL